MKYLDVKLFIAAVLGLFAMNTYGLDLYVFNGDSDTGFIVDTDAQTFTSFDTTDADIGYAVAVTDRVILGDRDDRVAAEYDLNGNFTGNTFPGGGNFSQLLDGTTNGIDANYGIECCDTTISVTVADLNWQNQSVLFDIPFNGSGITYDPSTDTLWVSTFDNGDIRNFSLTGTELSSFPATDISAGDACCMAYDTETDTLWIGENNTNVLYNYSKTGTLIESITIPGWDPGNIYGAEAVMVGALPESVAVPTINIFGMLLMALLVLVVGLTVKRNQRFN